MLTHPTLHVGDRLRFPIGQLGDQDVYRRQWQICAFTHDGIVCRRMHDGICRTVSEYWVLRYSTEYQYLRVAACPPRTLSHYGKGYSDQTYRVEWQESYSYYRQAQAYQDARAVKLANLRARRLAELDWQIDRAQPGYYVSARNRDHTRYALLIGPFADHYSALQMVPIGRYAAREYDQYHDIGYGTCQVATSEKDGKFNDQVKG